jgi:hypothetical protein
MLGDGVLLERFRVNAPLSANLATMAFSHMITTRRAVCSLALALRRLQHVNHVHVRLGALHRPESPVAQRTSVLIVFRPLDGGQLLVGFVLPLPVLLAGL